MRNPWSSRVHIIQTYQGGLRLDLRESDLHLQHPFWPCRQTVDRPQTQPAGYTLLRSMHFSRIDVKATGLKSFICFTLGFFGIGIMTELFHARGTDMLSRNNWNRRANTGPSCGAHTLITLPLRPSGPGALEGLSLDKHEITAPSSMHTFEYVFKWMHQYSIVSSLPHCFGRMTGILCATEVARRTDTEIRVSTEGWPRDPGHWFKHVVCLLIWGFGHRKCDICYLQNGQRADSLSCVDPRWSVMSACH